MSEDFLQSTDSIRSGRTLKHARQVTFAQPLKLELGGQLPSVTVAYETYGQLNAAGDNAVFICHAISGDSHVARHDDLDDAGWWDILVGPGKAIDTSRYFVICPNILGGCRGTTGPSSINPETQQPYGRDFPTITVGDIVEVHRRLVDHLGIGRLLAVVGGSMGGHQALAWGVRFPERARGIIPLATSPRLSSQSLAFDIVGRNAILSDPDFKGGQYYNAGSGPADGLALARMIGHITYLSPQAMKEKFDADRLKPRDVPTEFEKKFSVGSYLGYQGSRFVERFDANSYIALTMAMDLFDLGDTLEQLTATFSASQARWLVVSFTSDWLFPPEQSRQMVHALLKAGKQVSYCNVESSCGHDAFLLPNDLDVYGDLVRAFLTNLDAHRSAGGEPAETHPADWQNPTSIFHPLRQDYNLIADLIPPGASVLDLGCEAGSLLSLLGRRGAARRVGLELSQRAIRACVCRGLDVIHADLNAGLDLFDDGQFDYVVLSQTLQAVYDVEGVVDDMLRVGRRCIVSFPNFAYHKLRKMLAEDGHAPSAGLLRFKWYDSPNIRFLTIADFEDFCRDKGITVHRTIALDSEDRREVISEPNLNADLAIFVLSR